MTVALRALPPPPADAAQLLVPHAHRQFPLALVVGRERVRGLLVRCPCGAERWTTFGHAQRHYERCALVERLAWQALGRRGTPLAAVRKALPGSSADVARRLGLSRIRARVYLRELEALGDAVRHGPAPHGWTLHPTLVRRYRRR